MPDDELTSLNQHISRMKPKPDLSRSKSQGLKDKKHLQQSPYISVKKPIKEWLWGMYNPLSSHQDLLMNLVEHEQISLVKDILNVFSARHRIFYNFTICDQCVDHRFLPF